MSSHGFRLPPLFSQTVGGGEGVEEEEEWEEAEKRIRTKNLRN